MYFRSQRKSAQDVSLSDYIETGSDGAALSLMDVVSEDCDLLEQVAGQEMALQLHRAVDSCLTEQERQVIRLRYGLSGIPPKRQREVAAELGISRSYISRIEKRALQKLREELENQKTLAEQRISDLMTIHQKSGIGRLSAYCGAVSAGVGAGAGAGIAYLLDGSYRTIAHTIVNAVAMYIAGAPIGERIATPVCGRVRNDSYFGIDAATAQLLCYCGARVISQYNVPALEHKRLPPGGSCRNRRLFGTDCCD